MKNSYTWTGEALCPHNPSNALYLFWTGRVKAILILLSAFLLIGADAFGQNKPAASLEQIRNGSATSPVSPAQWQNGNAGNQTAHYVEGHSIGYRALLTNLPANTTVNLIMAYDIRHSGKNAIDFLTHFDRLDPHAQFTTGGDHPAQEVVDPRLGTSFVNQAPTSTFVIPRPGINNSIDVPGTAWDAISTIKKSMTMWGATITNIQYDGQADLSVAQSEQRIIVTFTTGSSGGSAVLAWGGHIASRLDWGYDAAGVPLSAGGISGSPYHMRLKNWELGNLGNQDRSLSASAVIPPPDCDLTGPTTVCPGSNNVYTTDVVADTYTWTLENNTGGSEFNPAPTSTSTSVTVNAGSSTTGGSYTVKLVTTRDGITSTENCQEVVTVNPNPTADAGTAPADQCLIESGNSFALDGDGANGSPSWAIFSNPDNLTVNIQNGNTFDPTVIVTGVGTVTLRLTVTSNSDPSCGSVYDDVIVTVDPNPTISDPAIGAICAATTSAELSYSGVENGADQYKIVWSTAGLTSMTEFATLPASPIEISGTGSLAAGTYSGTIYVRNSSTSCESAGDAISLVVHPNPTANAGADPDAQCFIASGNSFSLDGDGANGTPSWAVQSNPNSLVVNIENGDTFDPTVSVTGVGTVTLRLTVTSGTTPSCSTDFDDVDLTVSPSAEGPAVTYNAPACYEPVFSVSVNNPVVGVTYTIADKDGNNIESIEATAADQDVTFINRAAGSGYSVTASIGECISEPTTCEAPAATNLKTEETSNLRKVEGPMLSNEKVTAYPVPFSEKLNLEFYTEQDGSFEVVLYDISGKALRQLKSGTAKAGEMQRVEVEGNNLKDGMYMVGVMSGSTRQTIRIIKKQE